MELKKEYTPRGFGIIYFNDNYKNKCSLQESSSYEPHIWLGVHDINAKIQWKDAQKLGLNLQKENPECNEFGWCVYPIPSEVSFNSRMHLNQEQAKILGKKLLKFAETGKI